MRIGIDARFYSQAGVGRYLRNLILNLAEIDRSNEYYVFLGSKDFDGEKFPANFHKVRADISWYSIKEQIQLPRLLNKYKLDLMHFPHFNIPVFYRGKFVVTIHDLIHQHFAMKRSTTHSLFIYKLKHQAYNFTFATALKKSQRVITVSEYVRNQLIKDWAVDDKKIDLTLEAAEKQMIDLAKEMKKEEIEKVLKKFNIKSPFIFYVGNAHPHKNVGGLIKAFLKLRENYQDLTLVLAGHDHFFWQRIKNENLQKDINYTGYVTDRELVALYKSAALYVLPSFEEGFGIPLLEAMAAGTPVVSSSAASLKEVGGEAAVYFDPKNIEEMVQKIGLVLNDEKLKKTMIEKGQVNYKKFSWRRLAEQTQKTYMEALKN